MHYTYCKQTTHLLLVILLAACATIRTAGNAAEPPTDEPAEQPAEHEHTNALIHEKSPYLLQHAHNPIDWVAWSDEALARAKREKKLIFLSIGYSTCHWCHMMERECFEDEEVAAVLNRDFVCIKVDREERPDVDNVYMSIAQGLGGGNGWPLTVVMTPEGRPFFAGTYIPKHDKYGIMGLMRRLPTLVRQYRHGSNLLDEAAARAERRIELLNTSTRPEVWTIDTQQLDEVFARLMPGHDPVYGGFGISMKFPRPHQLLYLLSYHRRTGNESALAAVRLTLDRIRAGGIYDQLGYGIHRYAVDRTWTVPHFEKMLYDQAQLALVCAECYHVTGEARYRRMTEELFEYVLRDLALPNGAFCSAEDADSEGEEGKFYLWTHDELQDALSNEQFEAVDKVFAVKPDGNWFDRAADEAQPTNILFMTDEGAQSLADASDAFRGRFDATRAALLKRRAGRVRPLRDDTVLADWNGLMIVALARGGRRLEDQRYTRAAAKAFALVETHLRDDTGRLLHRWRDGDAAVPAFLDDHVFLAWGAVELYRSTYDPKYLESARQLLDDVELRFLDDEEGSYFFTAADAQRLPIRPKKFADMEVPSGNSVAMLVLSELGRLTGEPQYENRAARLERFMARGALHVPTRATLCALGLEYRRRPGVEVVVVGDPAADDTQRMLSLVEQHAAAGAVEMAILLKNPNDKNDVLAEVAPFTQAHRTIDGKATAYVCRQRTCKAPTNDLEVLRQQLAEEPR